MSAILSRYGLTVAGVNESIQKLMKKEYSIVLPIPFTVAQTARQNGYIAKPELCDVFYMNAENNLVLPRNAVMNPAINRHIKTISVSHLSAGEDLPADREFGIELLGNQELVVNTITNIYLSPQKIQSNLATCLLQLCTGAGKTYVGSAIVHYIGKKTLWVLPNTSILEQTAEVLEVAFPTLKIGRWFSEKKDNPAEHDIILILVDSLITMARTGVVEFIIKEDVPGKKRQAKTIKKYTVSEWMNMFGLTVFDEVHMYTGPIYSAIFWFFSANVVFSMSATVNENKNGLDEIYKMHFGREIVASNIPGFQSTDLAWKRKLVVIKYYGAGEYIVPVINKYTNVLSFFDTVSKISTDPTRNKLIIDLVEEAVAAGHYLFVFSEYRNHAANLAKMYRQRNKDASISLEVEEEKSVVLMGGSSEEDVEIARTGAKVVFTTYSYCAVGVSITTMSALILATPRKSGLQQITGRIERRGGDLSVERVVYDIVDQLSPLNKQFNTRKLVYKNKEYSVEERKERF